MARLLMGDQTITLIKHTKEADGDTYACYTMPNASWFSKTTIVTSGDGAKPANSYTVRIPSEYFPVGILPDLGDYVARGVVTRVTKPADLKGVEHFRITSIGANNRGNLSHWRVDGQ